MHERMLKDGGSDNMQMTLEGFYFCANREAEGQFIACWHSLEDECIF
jgi:hypothetical protein